MLDPSGPDGAPLVHGTGSGGGDFFGVAISGFLARARGLSGRADTRTATSGWSTPRGHGTGFSGVIPKSMDYFFCN
jgi:hypothetical protein